MGNFLLVKAGCSFAVASTLAKIISLWFLSISANFSKIGYNFKEWSHHGAYNYKNTYLSELQTISS